MLLADEKSPCCAKLKCGRRDTCPMVSSIAPKNVAGPVVDDAGDVHVLAVDDSVIDRICIERLLKTSAYKVTAVDSGRKALEILQACETHGPVTFSVTTSHCSLASESGIPEQWQANDEVNLIITDYCMPGMSGYDLLKKVKGTNALKEIPVVIMSSENEPSRISSCLAEGAEEFLVKPVRLADVKRLRVHARHRQGPLLSMQDEKAVKSKGEEPSPANSKP